MHTSARNAFFGHVTRIRQTPILTEITLSTPSGYELVSVITSESFARLDLATGEPVMALVKAPDVLIGTGEAKGQLSARNCFAGSVTGLRNRGVAVEIEGLLPDGTPMCAVCTSESRQRLGIGEGDRVWFFFKAISLIVSAAPTKGADGLTTPGGPS